MFALCKSSLNHIPIKSRGPIKKTSHLRPIYLICMLAARRKMKIAMWFLVVVSKFKGGDRMQYH